MVGASHVTKTVWTKDGKYIIAGSRENKLDVWNFELKQIHCTIKLQYPSPDLELFNDQKTLIVVQDTQVMFYDFNNGVLSRNDSIESLSGYTFNHIRVTPDDKFIVTSHLQYADIIVWDAITKKAYLHISGAYYTCSTNYWNIIGWKMDYFMWKQCNEVMGCKNWYR